MAAAVAGDSLQRAMALHALNRLTFGPRSGDVERVLTTGIDRWIERQLHPEAIPDPRLDAALADLDILKLTTDDLAEMFFRDQQERRRRQLAMRDSVQSMDAAANPRARRQGPRNQLRRLTGQFQQLAVTRAVLSQRQLYEVIVDFWTNHFNVFLGKGQVRYLAPDYIEGVIRPHALGRFEDLLVATAQSPAMLFYLDNAQSVAPGSEPPRLAQMEQRLRRMLTARDSRTGTEGDRIRQTERRLQQTRARLPKGLNENYARELLELHTLGVDGGYTQEDVINVARVLTGWSANRPGQRGARFVFNTWAHDTDEKIVLGRKFAPGGMEEGMELLRMLSRHPSTMRYISRKLCVRLVSDDPPDGCVAAGARAWEASGGDIREVLRAIITSPEFWNPELRGTKTKTPLEFVVSAVRAIDAEPDETPGLAGLVARLGQPLLMHQAPNGYPETQQSWVNAGALLNRLNTALGFAAGRVPGAKIDLTRVVAVSDDLDEMLAGVNAAILNGTASANTLRIMRQQAEQTSDRRQARAVLIGYAIGSPEFQRQ
jgi:uncharacterized protein (DUF1800 family)